MKLHYGSKRQRPLKSRPGRSRMCLIQEREYASWRDYQHAVRDIQADCARRGITNYNLFANGYNAHGVPRLYFCRNWTVTELHKAGYTPAQFYGAVWYAQHLGV